MEWVGGVYSSEGQRGWSRYIDALGHCWEGGGVVIVEWVGEDYSSEGKKGRGRYIDALGHWKGGGVVDVE